MASLPTHAIAAAAIGTVAGAPPRVLVWAAICACIPDADVIAFGLGIPYEHPLGHRGFSHSLLFAAIAGAAVWLATRGGWRAALVCAAATASHGLLDACTDGGLGVGFFIPFDNGRYYLPWRPIRTSPISVRDFISRYGLSVLANEAVYVWTPAAIAALASAVARNWRRR